MVLYAKEFCKPYQVNPTPPPSAAHSWPGNAPLPFPVGFNYASLAEMMERYPPSEMRDGFNDNGEETVFYVSNPALGLWAVKEHLMREDGEQESKPGKC